LGNLLAPKRDRLDLAHAFLIRIGKVVSAVQAKKVSEFSKEIAPEV
jgi:hypothetical protein